MTPTDPTKCFAKKKEADARRRDKAQAESGEDLHGGAFMRITQMARAVTDHTTPVSIGTVARTKRIPVEQRAEAAVIAGMRHQTTGYDNMEIPRIKGKRREARRMLARRSYDLLERYRRGEPVGDERPLKKAMVNGPVGQTGAFDVSR